MKKKSVAKNSPPKSAETINCLFCSYSGSLAGLRQHWCAASTAKGKRKTAPLAAEQVQQCVAATKPAASPFTALVETSAKLLAAAGNVPVPTEAPVPVPQPSINTNPNPHPKQMKLTIARSHLAAALAAVRNLAAAKPDATHPILANVLLVADGKTLTLTTTDLAVSLRTQVAAEVHLKGSTTVRASLLHDLCKSFKADRITLTLDTGTGDAPATVLKLVAGTAKFELATMDAAEFPAVVEVTEPQSIELLEHELALLLRRTSFCASTDNTDAKRAVLTGTLIRMDSETFVASCDGLRLAVEQGAPTSIKADLVLPARAVAELLRLLSTDPEKPRTIAIQFNTAQAQLTFGEHHLITNLIAGDYPDYTQLIPPLEDSKIVTVNREALLSAVRRVALIADGVELVFKPKSLHINSYDSSGEQHGKSVENLLTTGNVDVTTHLATSLLVAALEAIQSVEVNLYPSADKPLAIHDPTATWLGVIAAMQ